MITVIDVFRRLGVEPIPAVTWSVGATVRELYAERFGHLPPKDNRPKTNANGTHCFALYPDDWSETIAGVIRSLRAEEARQKDLFR